MDHPSFKAFTEAQAREGKSSLTARAYLGDLRHFAAWFAQTNGERFAPGGMTSLDVRGYRSYMLTVAQFKPATINRRLAALTKY